MKIHIVEQNTLEWMKLHIGIPTAGTLNQMLDTSFNLRTGEMPKTYIHQKLAEKWRGKPLIDLSSSASFSTEQGFILEDEARPWAAIELELNIDEVGFITTDDGKCGCSPDGIAISKKLGFEIKCPAAHTHVKYLLGDCVPKEYLVQVHSSMYVTGFKKWMFLSYRRGFPQLVVEVKRDEEIIAKIKKAVDQFHQDFDKALNRLNELNEE